MAEAHVSAVAMYLGKSYRDFLKLPLNFWEIKQCKVMVNLKDFFLDRFSSALFGLVI